jgi:hypothetical protein
MSLHVCVLYLESDDNYNRPDTSGLVWLKTHNVGRLWHLGYVTLLHNFRDVYAVTYLEFFGGGGVRQIKLRKEGRENGDLWAVAR